MLLLLILSQIALCAQGAQGAQGTPNLIIFELREPRGYQQSSLEWNDKEITYTTNSNFTQANGQKALLGIFHTKLEEPEKMQLKDFLSQLKKHKNPSNQTSLQHSIEVKLSEKNISAGTKLYADILKFMQNLSRRGDWMTKDGLQVELNTQKEPQVKILSEKTRDSTIQNECKKSQGEIFCIIKPYGYARFEELEKISPKASTK